MVATVGTDLQSLLEFSFVKMSFAAIALNEDILGLDYTLLGRNSLNLLTLFAKPGHKKIQFTRKKARQVVYGVKSLAQKTSPLKDEVCSESRRGTLLVQGFAPQSKEFI